MTFCCKAIEVPGSSAARKASRRVGILLATALALAACNTLPDEARQDQTLASQDTPKEAGKTDRGRSCSYVARPQTRDAVFQGDYTITCDGYDGISGQVRQGAAASLEQAVQNPAWRSQLDRVAECGAIKAVGTGGADAALSLECRLKGVGVDYLAYVQSVGGKTYYVDGLAAALPALSSVVAQVSGTAGSSGTVNLTDQISAQYGAKSSDPDSIGKYKSLMKLGTLANDAGDYARAEQIFKDAQAVQSTLDPDPASRARTLLHVALQLSNQGQYGTADTLFLESESLIGTSIDPTDRARFYLYRAEDQANQGKLDKATQYAQLAEDLYASLVPDSLLDAARNLRRSSTTTAIDVAVLGQTGNQGVAGLATTWEVDAGLAARRGQTDQVSRLTAQIQTLLDLSHLSPPGVLPRALIWQAVVEADKGEVSAANAGLENVAERFESYQGKDRSFIRTRFTQGDVLARAHQDADALSKFREGAELAGKLHAELSASLVEPYLSLLVRQQGDAAKLGAEFVNAVQLVRTGNVTEAVVARTFAGMSIDERAKGPAEDLQGDDLKLDQLFSAQAAAHDPEKLKELSEQIKAVREDRAEAERKVAAASPEYADVLQDNPSVEQIRSALQSSGDEALVGYLNTPAAIYGYFISRDGVRFFKAGISLADLKQSVEALRQSITHTLNPRTHPTGSLLPPYDVALAHKLFKALFEPIEPSIGQLKRLVVVTSGPSASIPLDILVTADTPAVTDGDYRAVPFLVKQVAINYFPSVKVFVSLRTKVRENTATRRYIGFGDPVPASPEALAATFPAAQCGTDAQVLHLRRLKGTIKEIQSVGAVFQAPPGDMILGQNFSKEALGKVPLADYRIVHFATHGLLSSDAHCLDHEPQIALSADPKSTDAHDSFLSLSEVEKLNLSADLVVLSACNSAGPGGSADAGDSLSGLATGFFRAHARGLLVTHWPLSDAIAPVLVSGALDADKRQDSTEALQSVKLAILRGDVETPKSWQKYESSHPYLWAPMVLVGDGLRVASPAHVAHVESGKGSG